MHEMFQCFSINHLPLYNLVTEQLLQMHLKESGEDTELSQNELALMKVKYFWMFYNCDRCTIIGTDYPWFIITPKIRSSHFGDEDPEKKAPPYTKLCRGDSRKMDNVTIVILSLVEHDGWPCFCITRKFNKNNETCAWRNRLVSAIYYDIFQSRTLLNHD